MKRQFSVRLFLAGLALGVIGGAAVYVAVASAGIASTKKQPPLQAAAPAATASADPVIQWNRILLGILRTPGAQPATIHATRSMAILHAAIYDAVNAITKTNAPYLVKVRAPRGASERAAVAAAANRVLVALYPAQKGPLDADLTASLAQVPDGKSKDQGILVGETAADRILATRSNDGSSANPIVFVPGTASGDYQPTPPAFAQPVFTHWQFVRPFALERAGQFRPAPPPSLASAAYTAAFDEVKDLGSSTSVSRTPDQTQIARFWAAPIQNYWNEIAQTVALAHRTTLAQNARLFALLDLSLADSTIAFYDAKYTYRFWRPVTAIRAGATDGNSATVADPSWTPLATTALDPSYPGAHSTIGAAGATVLRSFFGSDHDAFSVSSEVLASVQRSFTSFSGAAEEAGLSRIYAGQHFRTDHVAGRLLGRRVAVYVLRHFLRREP